MDTSNNMKNINPELYATCKEMTVIIKDYNRKLKANFKAIKHAWQAHKHDGAASIITFGATLGFAPHLDNGIMIGAGLALGDREGGDGSKYLEGVDGVDVGIAVDISEEGGWVASRSRSGKCAAETGTAGLLVWG